MTSQMRLEHGWLDCSGDTCRLCTFMMAVIRLQHNYIYIFYSFWPVAYGWSSGVLRPTNPLRVSVYDRRTLSVGTKKSAQHAPSLSDIYGQHLNHLASNPPVLLGQFSDDASSVGPTSDLIFGTATRFVSVADLGPRPARVFAGPGRSCGERENPAATT